MGIKKILRTLISFILFFIVSENAQSFYLSQSTAKQNIQTWKLLDDGTDESHGIFLAKNNSKIVRVKKMLKFLFDKGKLNSIFSHHGQFFL